MTLDIGDLPKIENAWAAHAGDVVFLRLSRPIRSKDEAAYYRDMAESLLQQTRVHLVFLDDGTEIVSPTTGEAM